jgi:hypothetical protein
MFVLRQNIKQMCFLYYDDIYVLYTQYDNPFVILLPAYYNGDG